MGIGIVASEKSHVLYYRYRAWCVEVSVNQLLITSLEPFLCFVLVVDTFKVITVRSELRFCIDMNTPQVVYVQLSKRTLCGMIFVGRVFEITEQRGHFKRLGKRVTSLLTRRRSRSGSQDREVTTHSGHDYDGMFDRLLSSILEFRMLNGATQAPIIQTYPKVSS